VRGWVGIELKQVSDEELTLHLREAWRLIAPEKLQVLLEVSPSESEQLKKLSRRKR
jgi:hypothetical protein